MPSRVEAKPGRSRTTIVSFPIRLPNASAAARVASLVRSPTTISSSAITQTGLKKCMPMKRSGAARSAASSPIAIPLVLLARTAGVRASASASTRRLRSSSSGTASTISGNPARISVAEPRGTILARAAAASARARSASTSSTTDPATAKAWAIPTPMAPPPITAMPASDSFIRWAISPEPIASPSERLAAGSWTLDAGRPPGSLREG